MTKVKVLVEGYAKQIEGGWIASSTVTLVQADSKNIIVDPGCNREKLLEALTKEGLRTSDIDFVVLTHGHTDHSLLAGIFENAKVANSTEVYTGDEQIEYEDQIPDLGLEVIRTPGHSDDGISLVVRTEEGVYVIAADVFWWKEGENQGVDLEKQDPYAEDGAMNELINSRKKVLDIANFVIPGHGRMFKVK